MTVENLVQELAQRVTYSDGQIFWSDSKKGWNGRRAGSYEKKGYEVINHKNKIIKSHRVIFFMHHGWLPERIDHIDGNPKNNRIENLRAATVTENAQNMPPRVQGQLKGAHFHKAIKKWCSSIRVNGKRLHLGTFSTMQDAHSAYVEAAKKYFGEFARIA